MLKKIIKELTPNIVFRLYRILFKKRSKAKTNVEAEVVSEDISTLIEDYEIEFIAK